MKRIVQFLPPLRVLCLALCGQVLVGGCSFDPLPWFDRGDVPEESEEQQSTEEQEDTLNHEQPTPAVPTLCFSVERVAFPLEGGSRAVTVSSESPVVWEVTGSPEWCALTEGEEGFTVTAPAGGPEGREGFILLSATFSEEDQREVSLRVSQAGERPLSFAMTFEGLTAWKETWQRGSVPETTVGEELSQVQLYCTNGLYTLLAAGLSRYVFFLNWSPEGTPPPLDKDMQSTEYHEKADSYTIQVSGKGAAETASESFAVTYRLDIGWLDHPSPELRFEARYEYDNSDQENPRCLTCTEKACLSMTQYTPLL